MAFSDPSARWLVVDGGAIADADQASLLVRPARLVDEEQHVAKFAFALVGARQGSHRGDQVAGTDRREVAAALAAVQHARAGCRPHPAQPGLAARVLAHPGEGVEVARRHQPGPGPALGSLLVGELRW